MPGSPGRRGRPVYLPADVYLPEVEAAVELAHDLDASGMHSVRLHQVGFLDFC